MANNQYKALPIRHGTLLTRGNIRQTLLFCLLTSVSILPPGFASVVIAAAIGLCLFLDELRISRGLLRLVYVFPLLLVLGIHGFLSHPGYRALKDVWYITNPFLALTCGFLIAQRDLSGRQVLRVLVISGVLAGFVHLLLFSSEWVKGVSLIAVRDSEHIRGYFITVVALAVLLLPNRYGRSLFRGRAISSFFVVSCVVSVLLSFSRTYLLCLSIFFLGAYASFGLSTRNHVRAITSIALAVSVAIAMSAMNIGWDFGALVDKYETSFSEMQIKNYNDFSEINRNWRGFESFKALGQFEKLSLFGQLFGGGVGQTVDVGFHMKLGDSYIRDVPIIHNGFLYVLIKTGVLGLLAYIFWLFALFKWAFAIDRHLVTPQRVVCARIFGYGILCVFAMSFVITGVFNKQTLTAFLISLGSLYAIAQVQISDKSMSAPR